ncbi:MAG TPA: hypothetical protein VH092_06245 [Urbifossiella sp.]|nr:hypothetical protein [Urbifossiella sp.]
MSSRNRQTPLITAECFDRIRAAVGRPDLELHDQPRARRAVWNEPGAVTRFAGLAHELLNELTIGLNVLMDNVGCREREAQMRRAADGDGFDFARVRDLVRVASNLIGEALPDQYWDDSVNATSDELGGCGRAGCSLPLLAVTVRKPPTRRPPAAKRISGLAKVKC